MGDHDIIPTCLSAEEHGEDGISDKTLHYLGCLEFCRREQYFETLKKEHRDLIESELRRIKYLRHVLQQDREDSPLIMNLEKSMTAWKNCELFKSEDGIIAVREWRSGKGRTNDKKQRNPQDSPSPRSTNSRYNPDRDLNAYLVRYVQSEGVTDLQGNAFSGHFPNHKIAVSVLLDENNESNPLAREFHPDQSINYFHLPANNMHVSFPPFSFAQMPC